jgi:hypothetical protein
MLVTLLGAAISGEVLHGVRRDYRRQCDGRAPVAGPDSDDRELACIAAGLVRDGQGRGGNESTRAVTLFHEVHVIKELRPRLPQPEPISSRSSSPMISYEVIGGGGRARTENQ